MADVQSLDIPQLGPVNYGPWLLGLLTAALGNDALHYILQNPLPAKPQKRAAYIKNPTYILSKMLATIHAEILNLLIKPDAEPTPFDLLTNVKAHMNTNNANNHNYLKSLAEAPDFLPGITLEHYVAAHEKIRTRMIAARYPSIRPPAVNFEFMIDGLRDNPDTAGIGLRLIATNLAGTKEFTQQFNRLRPYKNVHPPTIAPIQGLTSSTTGIELTPVLNLHSSLRSSCATKPDKTKCHTKPHYPRLRVRYRASTMSPSASPARVTPTSNAATRTTRTKNRRNATRKTAARATEAHLDYVQIIADLQHHLHSQATSNAHNDSNDDEGMYLIDFLSQPSRVGVLLNTMNTLPFPIITTTDTNDASPCTHQRMIQIATSSPKPLILRAVANTRLTRNLLTFHGIATQHGPLIFKPQATLMLSKQAGSPIFKLGSWNRRLLPYKTTSRPPTQIPQACCAKGARTQPLVPIKTRNSLPSSHQPTPTAPQQRTAPPNSIRLPALPRTRKHVHLSDRPTRLASSPAHTAFFHD